MNEEEKIENMIVDNVIQGNREVIAGFTTVTVFIGKRRLNWF